MKRLIILAPLLLAGCGGSPESMAPIQTPTATPEPLTPQSVAEQYLQAAQARDIAGIAELSCHNYIPDLPTPQEWEVTGTEQATTTEGPQDSYTRAIATVDGQQWSIEVWESEVFFQRVASVVSKMNSERAGTSLPPLPMPDRAEYNSEQYCIQEVKRL